MGSWGTGLYDSDPALDGLGQLFQLLRVNHPHQLISVAALCVWLNPPISFDHKLMTALQKEHQSQKSLPSPVHELIDRWVKDPEAFEKNASRSEEVKQILGNYCDGPRHDVLLDLPETQIIIGDLIQLCEGQLDKMFETITNLDDDADDADTFEGTIANMGVLLELAWVGRYHPSTKTLMNWYKKAQRLDKTTHDERDFFDEYFPKLYQCLELLQSRARLE